MKSYIYIQKLCSYYEIAQTINHILSQYTLYELVTVIGSSNPGGGQGDAILIFRREKHELDA
jgi:hypothetical protein